VCGPLNGMPEENWAAEFPNGPPAHVNCRCSTSLTMDDEATVRAEAIASQTAREKLLREKAEGEKPKPTFVPAQTVEEAYALAEAHGLKVGGRNAREIVNIMADTHEAEFGPWTADRPRQGFVDNWLPVMEQAVVPEAYQRDVINGVVEQMARGATETRPLIIHGPRPGYNDQWSAGQHDKGTGLIRIFYHENALPYVQESITDALANADHIYDNRFGGIWNHEYGHAYHDANPDVLRRAQTYETRIDTDKEFRQWAKKNVSHYAASNARELAAECYTLRQHPNFEDLPNDAKSLISEILGF